jgi:hypothetical protein
MALRSPFSRAKKPTPTPAPPAPSAPPAQTLADLQATADAAAATCVEAKARYERTRDLMREALADYNAAIVASTVACEALSAAVEAARIAAGGEPAPEATPNDAPAPEAFSAASRTAPVNPFVERLAARLRLARRSAS